MLNTGQKNLEMKEIQWMLHGRFGKIDFGGRKNEVEVTKYPSFFKGVAVFSGHGASLGRTGSADPHLGEGQVRICGGTDLDLLDGQKRVGGGLEKVDVALEVWKN